MDPVEKVMHDAKNLMSKGDIDNIVLVGGSTRIPKIRSMLRELFNGKELKCSINPEEVVAHGAAIYAAILSHVRHDSLSDILLVDVIPHSCGICICETTDEQKRLNELVNASLGFSNGSLPSQRLDGDTGVMSVLIKRNSFIPTKTSRVYTTNEDNQTSVLIRLYEGEQKQIINNHYLGEFRVNNIPPLPKGQPQIEITVSFDSDHIIILSASCKSADGNKVVTELTVDTSTLSTSKIMLEDMIAEAEKHACYQEKSKQLVMTQFAARTYAQSMMTKINSNEFKSSVSNSEQQFVHRAVMGFDNWLNENNRTASGTIQYQIGAIDGARSLLESVLGQVSEVKPEPEVKTQDKMNVVDTLRSMSVKALKHMLIAAGVNFDDCVEKSDLVEKLRPHYQLPLTTMHPMGWTLADSHFQAQFGTQILKVTLATEVFANVSGFLQSFLQASPTTTAAVSNFVERLRKEVVDAGIDSMGHAGAVAELLWSSAVTMQGNGGNGGRRLYSFINQALREDPADEVVAWRLAGVVRAINAVRNVRGRAPDAIRFPPGGMTYRGGGFNDTHKSFFQVGRKYRVPGFLATSFSKEVSISFRDLATGSSILWVVHSKKGCKHAYLIDSHLPHEKEFLFTAFSVFTVRKVEWGTAGAPHLVELDAAFDNEVESKELPLAPWY